MNNNNLKINQLFLAILIGFILSITTTKQLSSLLNFSLAKAENFLTETQNFERVNLIKLALVMTLKII
jgi:hypothetical protein